MKNLTFSKVPLSLAALALLAVFGLAGCGGGGGGGNAGGNAAPAANAGPDQNISTGSLVTLTGSGSSDANSDTLTYNWSFTSTPAGSTATLSSATVVNPTFTADKDGAYVLSLIVNDGTVSSAADTVTITAAPALSATGRMPDTNQTTSYTSTFGEDHDYTINPPSYTDNGNGTITDNVTGLIWQKQDDATTRSWADAGTYCDTSTLGGYSDWRLPSRIELVSIIDNGVYEPSINTAFFPGTISSGYWSSTTYAGDASYAWSVSFRNGTTTHASCWGSTDGSSGCYDKTYSYYVRCVRGGQ